MTDRERAILQLMSDYPYLANGTVAIARCLNFDATCAWCPVLPPRPGTACAVVPRRSADRVRRVLLLLQREGLVEQLWPGTRLAFWRLTDKGKAAILQKGVNNARETADRR